MGRESLCVGGIYFSVQGYLSFSVFKRYLERLKPASRDEKSEGKLEEEMKGKRAQEKDEKTEK